MLHVIYNLILIFGLWTLASGVQEKSFSDLCWGLVGLAMGFGFLIDSNQSARRFGVEGKSFRMDGSFYVLFACLVAARNAFYHLPFTFNLVFRCGSFAVVGLALIVLSPTRGPSHVVSTEHGAAPKESQPFKLPEHAVRLGLFAACLAIAAIATALLVRDERIRLVCFLTTMVVGLVGTKVLPLKALKWLLSSISLKKLKADE